MSAVSVRLGLDEARTAAAAREVEGALRRSVDDIDIVAVDEHWLEPVRASAVGCRMLYGRDSYNFV